MDFNTFILELIKSIYLYVLIFLLAILAARVILRITGKDKKAPGKQDLSILKYLKRTYFFNYTERQFYEVLREILPADLRLFAKVRLWDIFELPKNKADNYTLQNKIKAKHVDFLICDQVKIEPLLGIELDGDSHGQVNRIVRDIEVEVIFKSANLPLLHFDAANKYDKAAKDAILAEINSKLGRK